MSKLGRICTQCQGRGTVPNSDNDPTLVDCAACEGTGYEKIGEVDNADIETKLGAVETKLDALQSDMDIIKPQIQALYEDLNP